ncbi:hypothetical protein AB0I81_15520 [Nonomuraea sp. NPDC050404]|uniref:hypothetical protein n=1 Tax=Nonomuraea sp. NPDC050404 TaxID=3155783 RepID=UPI0033D85BC4
MPLRVHVVGRRAAAAAQLAEVGNVRAVIDGDPITFSANEADLPSDDAIAGEAVAARPDVVMQCASHHSPWESAIAPSAWTRWCASAGFGVTLALQARLVWRVSARLKDSGHAGTLLNACYPDAVNPLLSLLGGEVLAGLGNVATLAAGVSRATLGTVPPLRPRAADGRAAPSPDEARVRMLAHHIHLHRPANPDDEAMAWAGQTRLDDVGALLRPLRAIDRSRLNDIAGHAAARLAGALLNGGSLRTHCSGPLGLPGGYPVVLDGGGLRLDLPPGLTRDQAVEWNQRMAAADGVVVRPDGRIVHPPSTARALRPYLPRLAAGFDADETENVADELLALRHRLRATLAEDLRTTTDDLRATTGERTEPCAARC